MKDWQDPTEADKLLEKVNEHAQGARPVPQAPCAIKWIQTKDEVFFEAKFAHRW